jgi:hypothetical protein
MIKRKLGHNSVVPEPYPAAAIIVAAARRWCAQRSTRLCLQDSVPEFLSNRRKAQFPGIGRSADVSASASR